MQVWGIGYRPRPAIFQVFHTYHCCQPEVGGYTCICVCLSCLDQFRIFFSCTCLSRKEDANNIYISISNMQTRCALTLSLSLSSLPLCLSPTRINSSLPYTYEHQHTHICIHTIYIHMHTHKRTPTLPTQHPPHTHITLCRPIKIFPPDAALFEAIF
jgi:hypothetical protein